MKTKITALKDEILNIQGFKYKLLSYYFLLAFQNVFGPVKEVVFYSKSTTKCNDFICRSVGVEIDIQKYAHIVLSCLFPFYVTFF